MARPLPVNLLLAATGGVLLVSGLSNEPLAEVLRGNFGDLKATSSNASAGAIVEGGEGSGPGAVGSTPSASTFAPSPASLSLPRGRPTKQQQAQGIAAILVSEGLVHPTSAQINKARLKYENETGARQFALAGESAPEFLHGLPLI